MALAVTALKEQIARARESLKNVDNDIKKRTGKDPNEPISITRTIDNKDSKSIRGKPYSSPYSVIARRGKSPVRDQGDNFDFLNWTPRGEHDNRTNQWRGRGRGFGGAFRGGMGRGRGDFRQEEEEEDEDDDDDGVKHTVQSSVVSTVEPHVEKELTKTDLIKAQNVDARGKARNRRMFGMLLGTLSSFQKNESKAELAGKQEQRKREIEQKFELKVYEERKQAAIERRELYNARRAQKRRIELLEQKVELAHQLEEWEGEWQKKSRFIMTKAKPSIFFLPKETSSRTQRAMYDSKTRIEAKVAKTRESLQQSLDDLDRRIQVIDGTWKNNEDEPKKLTAAKEDKNMVVEPVVADDLEANEPGTGITTIDVVAQVEGESEDKLSNGGANGDDITMGDAGKSDDSTVPQTKSDDDMSDGEENSHNKKPIDDEPKVDVANKSNNDEADDDQLVQKVSDDHMKLCENVSDVDKSDSVELANDTLEDTTDKVPVDDDNSDTIPDKFDDNNLNAATADVENSANVKEGNESNSDNSDDEKASDKNDEFEEEPMQVEIDLTSIPLPSSPLPMSMVGNSNDKSNEPVMNANKRIMDANKPIVDANKPIVDDNEQVVDANKSIVDDNNAFEDANKPGIVDNKTVVDANEPVDNVTDTAADKSEFIENQTSASKAESPDAKVAGKDSNDAMKSPSAIDNEKPEIIVIDDDEPAMKETNLMVLEGKSHKTGSGDVKKMPDLKSDDVKNIPPSSTSVKEDDDVKNQSGSKPIDEKKRPLAVLRKPRKHRESSDSSSTSSSSSSSDSSSSDDERDSHRHHSKKRRSPLYKSSSRRSPLSKSSSRRSPQSKSSSRRSPPAKSSSRRSPPSKSSSSRRSPTLSRREEDARRRAIASAQKRRPRSPSSSSDSDDSREKDSRHGSRKSPKRQRRSRSHSRSRHTSTKRKEKR